MSKVDESKYYYWIGLYKNTTNTAATNAQDGWKWVDGTAYDTSWSIWRAGQPKSDDQHALLYISRTDRDPHWNGEASGSVPNAFICEYGTTSRSPRTATPITSSTSSTQKSPTTMSTTIKASTTMPTSTTMSTTKSTTMSTTPMTTTEKMTRNPPTSPKTTTNPPVSTTITTSLQQDRSSSSSASTTLTTTASSNYTLTEHVPTPASASPWVIGLGVGFGVLLISLLGVIIYCRRPKKQQIPKENRYDEVHPYSPTYLTVTNQGYTENDEYTYIE